jgi:uncharacterized membrane protein
MFAATMHLSDPERHKMAETLHGGDSSGDFDQDLNLSNMRLSDPDRLETFSDGVFSITITLLVFDIVRPVYAPGHLLERLQAQWPNYIAFLASFFYVGIIWLNHRAVFSRVCYCSRSLHFANLFLLLTSGLIPFPTALLSTALLHESPVDASVAIELYAAIGCLMCLSWLFMFHILSANPHLLEAHIERTFFPRERHRALLGVVLYIVGGISGWAVSPIFALLCFLGLPIFYGITSEGLVETRIALLDRLAVVRSRRKSVRPRHPIDAPSGADDTLSAQARRWPRRQ